MENQEAETVAKAFYTGWIARFEVPLRITTDQRRQFESQLFKGLYTFRRQKKMLFLRIFLSVMKTYNTLYMTYIC